MKLFDDTLTQLSNALAMRLLPQNVLAGNLATVDTPGYQPTGVPVANVTSVVRPVPLARARIVLPRGARRRRAPNVRCAASKVARRSGRLGRVPVALVATGRPRGVRSAVGALVRVP